MILASPQDIKYYTDQGIWGTQTLLDCFKKHAQTMPDRVCIKDPLNKKDLLGTEPEQLTYKELEQIIDKTTAALIQMGIQKDDIIMVQMPNCWELAMLYLAVAQAGGILSPVPVLLREAELSYIADITKAKAFITVEAFNKFSHKQLALKLQSDFPHLKHVITYEELREFKNGSVSKETDPVHVDANDIFTICWTSGTEAKSKGCPLSHNNWISMSAMQDAAGIEPGDTLFLAGPLVNMAAVGTIYIPWLTLGGTLVIHHPFDPAVFMKQIVMDKVNYMVLVPAILNIIAKHPQVDAIDLSSVRSISTGSAPPSLWTMKEFKKRWGIDIGNIWGQNEGTGIVSGIKDIPDMSVRVDHFPHFGKSGVEWKTRAAKYVSTKIIDPDGKKLTKPGDVGELVYKGPGVIHEYFRNPEMTKNGFTEDGYFKTGDQFQIKENNLISFFERSKDIIIRGGYNISSQEVENYLLGHPHVQDAAVVSMPDEVMGEKMCAYVVPMEGQTVTLDDLTSLMDEKKIAKYKHPERLEIVDAIPRNSVGKIIKSTLRQDIRDKLTTTS